MLMNPSDMFNFCRAGDVSECRRHRDDECWFSMIFLSLSSSNDMFMNSNVMLNFCRAGDVSLNIPLELKAEQERLERLGLGETVSAYGLWVTQREE